MSYVLQVAQEWAARSGALSTKGTERPDDDDPRTTGELVLNYLRAEDPFPRGSTVSWAADDYTRQPGTIRERLGANDWLVDVKDADGTMWPVRAGSAELSPGRPPTGHLSAESIESTRGTLVCLDSAEENMVSELSLRAYRLSEGRWNGWVRPAATANALADFLRRWRANDPDGVWGDAIELDGRLMCTRDDGEEPDYFTRVATTTPGDALYDLTGWVWVELEML